jgi:hypothetical protein
MVEGRAVLESPLHYPPKAGTGFLVGLQNVRANVSRPARGIRIGGGLTYTSKRPSLGTGATTDMNLILIVWRRFPRELERKKLLEQGERNKE